MRKRKGRERAIGVRAPLPAEASPNARWSLDFVHERMVNGPRSRILNVVDDVTHECLAAFPDTSIAGHRVTRELTALTERRGRPGLIVSDKGAEFTSHAIFAWAKEARIEWHYIMPGKPMQNGCYGDGATLGAFSPTASSLVFSPDFTLPCDILLQLAFVFPALQEKTQP